MHIQIYWVMFWLDQSIIFIPLQLSKIYLRNNVKQISHKFLLLWYNTSKLSCCVFIKNLNLKWIFFCTVHQQLFWQFNFTTSGICISKLLLKLYLTIAQLKNITNNKVLVVINNSLRDFPKVHKTALTLMHFLENKSRNVYYTT